MTIKRLKITEGGQLSVPAVVRHRWKARTVVAEDHGDYKVVRPAPEDPIEAARGALAQYQGPTVDEMRRDSRDAECAAEFRREAG